MDIHVLQVNVNEPKLIQRVDIHFKVSPLASNLLQALASLVTNFMKVVYPLAMFTSTMYVTKLLTCLAAAWTLEPEALSTGRIVIYTINGGNITTGLCALPVPLAFLI